MGSFSSTVAVSVKLCDETSTASDRALSTLMIVSVLFVLIIKSLVFSFFFFFF